MKLIFTFLLSAISQLAVADECNLDQKVRIEENSKIQEQYHGSYLTEDKLILIIPVSEGYIRVNIGGCMHYGIKVELKTSNALKYKNESAFMSKILLLSQSYSQGIINPIKLKKVIDNKDWFQPDPAIKFYFINYNGSPFEAYENNEGKYTIIGFSYYS